MTAQLASKQSAAGTAGRDLRMCTRVSRVRVLARVRPHAQEAVQEAVLSTSLIDSTVTVCDHSKKLLTCKL